MEKGIEKAIRIAGGVCALADLIDVNYQNVQRWRKARVPAERIIQIEEALDRQVMRHELRPDLYVRR